jgi:hypothetical protein
MKLRVLKKGRPESSLIMVYTVERSLKMVLGMAMFSMNGRVLFQVMAERMITAYVPMLKDLREERAVLFVVAIPNPC